MPTTITPEIRALCRELVGDAEPQFVDVKPLANAEDLDCFPVVAQKVDRDGGAVCYGWRIWETPRVFVEAEFHAVWRDPQGALLDITPMPMYASRILFVPDPLRIYHGRQVNNVRRALIPDPAIEEFFHAADDEFDFMNRGARADQHGRIEVSGAEAEELLRIQGRKANAFMRILDSLPKAGRNDPCPCGSGKKFKKCCGG